MYHPFKTCILCIMLSLSVRIAMAQQETNTKLPFQSMDKVTSSAERKTQLPLPPLTIPGASAQRTSDNTSDHPASSAVSPSQQNPQGAAENAQESGNVRVLSGTSSVLPSSTPALPKPPAVPKSTQDLKKKLDLRYGLDRPLPVSAKSLPALGPFPGADRPVKPYVINLVDGQSIALQVSETMPNRIATPFQSPNVVDASGAKIKTIKGDIYLMPASSNPFGIFISDNTLSRSPVIALTLVPEEIPGQSVIVQIDGIAKLYQEEQQQNQGDGSYPDEIKRLNRQVISEITPQGFTVNDLPSHTARKGDIEIWPEKRYSGQSMDLFVYRLTNKGVSSVELTESSFYDKTVRAVAFYPDIRLDANQTTRVYILSWKE